MGSKLTTAKRHRKQSNFTIMTDHLSRRLIGRTAFWLADISYPVVERLLAV